MNREPRTHASSTVNRDQDGSIRYVVVRAEYFLEDVDEHENSDKKYTKGVSAKFKFTMNGTGTIAVLDSVKDIGDGASSGYETSLQFLKVLPVAEDAVMNVPGIEDVESAEEFIMYQIDKGRSAVRATSTSS